MTYFHASILPRKINQYTKLLTYQSVWQAYLWEKNHTMILNIRSCTHNSTVWYEKEFEICIYIVSYFEMIEILFCLSPPNIRAFNFTYCRSIYFFRCWHVTQLWRRIFMEWYEFKMFDSFVEFTIELTW